MHAGVKGFLGPCNVEVPRYVKNSYLLPITNKNTQITRDIKCENTYPVPRTLLFLLLQNAYIEFIGSSSVLPSTIPKLIFTNINKKKHKEINKENSYKLQRKILQPLIMPELIL